MDKYSRGRNGNDFKRWKLKQKFVKELEAFKVIPLDVGHEQCRAGHSWDEIRSCSLIHYVYSGNGVFTKNGKTYQLSRGDAFIINEGEENLYCADTENPWHYFWISFSSDSFGGKFTSLEEPVFKVSNESVFIEPIERAECGMLTPEFVISKLYLLYDELFNKIPKRSYDVATEAAIFINQSLASDLSVSEIAAEFGLDRSYLSRRFKKKYGISIKKYIINARINKACELLKKGVSVKEAALLSGYVDQLAFSRIFKGVVGMSPTQYRDTNK